MCFTPMNIFFAYKFCFFMYKILKPDESNVYNLIIKLNRFPNISSLSNFFSLITYTLLFTLFYYIGLFLDTKKDEQIFNSIYVGFALISLQLFYAFLRTLPQFSLNKHAIAYTKKNEDGEEEEDKTQYSAFMSIMGPIMTYFSNMMVICSTSSGTCSQLYMSTLSALLGAFGVSISNFSQYMFPLTVVLLLVSCYSLYAKRGSLTHKPFLLGVLATLLIIISQVIQSLWIFNYIGNVIMIGAAIWNYKMNKLMGLPRFK